MKMKMNTILYVSLTANGYVVQPDEGYPIPKEILANFRQVVQQTGNLINGRRTYELARAGGALDALSHVAFVVVSHEKLTAEGVEVVASPEAALQYLEHKGFRTALVGGGAGLDASFLSQGLVDEVYLNIEPSLTGAGLTIPATEGEHVALSLIETTRLSDSIVQLHYVVSR
jgi:dihydrofolate reductase